MSGLEIMGETGRAKKTSILSFLFSFFLSLSTFSLKNLILFLFWLFYQFSHFLKSKKIVV